MFLTKYSCGDTFESMASHGINMYRLLLYTPLLPSSPSSLFILFPLRLHLLFPFITCSPPCFLLSLPFLAYPSLFLPLFSYLSPSLISLPLISSSPSFQALVCTLNHTQVGEIALLVLPNRSCFCRPFALEL